MEAKFYYTLSTDFQYLCLPLRSSSSLIDPGICLENTACINTLYYNCMTKIFDIFLVLGACPKCLQSVWLLFFVLDYLWFFYSFLFPSSGGSPGEKYFLYQNWYVKYQAEIPKIVPMIFWGRSWKYIAVQKNIQIHNRVKVFKATNSVLMMTVVAFPGFCSTLWSSSMTAVSSIIMSTQYDSKKECPEMSKPTHKCPCLRQACLFSNSLRTVIFRDSKHSPVKFSTMWKIRVLRNQTTVPTAHEAMRRTANRTSLWTK